MAKSLGLRPEVTNLAILRGARHTLVHFNGGLPPLLFDHDGQGEFENIAQNADAAPILLELAQALLNHRMTHADGTFSNIMITLRGPVAGSMTPG